MFKLMSMALIFTSCSIIGFYKSFDIKRRKSILVEFQEFMLRISTEMGYFREPLPVLFERIITSDNSYINILLRQCHIDYHQTQKNFETLWTDAVNYTYKNSPLKEDDLQIFSKCGVFLGQSDFKSQQAHFELFQHQIIRQIEAVDDELTIKAGLYRKAGMSIGAVLAIVII